VRIGVHYIAFWSIFELCGIQPLEILDFCGHIRKSLMKIILIAQTSQNCVHNAQTLHFSYQNKPKLRPPVQNTTLSYGKCTKFDPIDVRLCTSMPMGSINSKVYGFKVVVYEMSEKDKEKQRNSENRCSSGNNGGAKAI
jgi:hypothetical protein